MGGTFNPVHYGHLMVAEDARNYCDLDKVIFMPSGNSYMKEADEILPGKMRIAMVEAAISSNPHFCSSDMEIKRQRNTYTYETLDEFHKIYPGDEFYFILGADNLLSVEKWRYSERVMQNSILIAASRGEVSFERLKEHADYLSKTYHAKVILLPERKMDLSSTEIRKRIKMGQSVRYMMPEKVCELIRENDLYQ